MEEQHISFHVKYRLYHSLVLSVVLYGCEAWTMTADTERRVQAFEFKCLRKLLGVSYRERKTNEFIRTSVNGLVETQ